MDFISVGKELLMRSPEKNFKEKVIEIIKRIPKGKVLTYGQVATLAGVPRAARIVGGILFNNGLGKEVPWQRVINSQGKLSTYRVGLGHVQKSLLEEEGLCFNSVGAINLDDYQWWPPSRVLNQLSLDEETAYHINHHLKF